MLYKYVYIFNAHIDGISRLNYKDKWLKYLINFI